MKFGEIKGKIQRNPTWGCYTERLCETLGKGSHGPQNPHRQSAGGGLTYTYYFGAGLFNRPNAGFLARRSQPASGDLQTRTDT